MVEKNTLTLLMTDVEGSTELWEKAPEDAALFFKQLDALTQEIAGRFEGTVVKPRGEGDSHFMIFPVPSQAVRAAIELQKAMVGGLARSRMAVHTGEVHCRDEEYYGSAVNRCARIRSAGHGGQVLVSDAAKDVMGIEAHEFIWKDHGFHLLRDLIEGIHIWEALVPGEPEISSPLNTLNPVSHNLPVQFTTFLGREADLEKIGSLIKTHRLVTLFGPGGSGKTRAALQVAGELTSIFPGGVRFADLSAITQGEVLNNVVQAFNLQLSESNIDELCDALQERTALLLLDNCEHVISEVQSVAKGILARCPGIKLLATSREALHLRGEACHEIKSLSLPPEGETSEKRIRNYEAVQLFEDRALLLGLGFTVSSANALAVAKLCYRLDGMPLSIELVAAQTRYYSPDELLAVVDDELMEINSREPGASGRQVSISATIEWSYSLLTESEKTFFTNLSVFPASFTSDAVAAIFEKGARSFLESLVEKHLVAVSTPQGKVRFRLLVMVRAFAQHKASTSPDIMAAFASYYSKLAAMTVEDTKRDATDYDKVNFEAALQYYERADCARYQALVHTLKEYWYRIGALEEGRKWLSIGAGLPDEDANRRADILNALSIHCWRLGDLAQARHWLQEARSVLGTPRNAEEHLLIAKFDLNLGSLASEAGNFDLALQHFEEALRICQEHRVQDRIANALYNVGICHRRMGNLKLGYGVITEALCIWEELDNPREVASCLLSLSEIHIDLGELAPASQELKKCFQIWGANTDHPKTSMGLLVLAKFASDQGDNYAAALFLGCAQNAFKTARQELNTPQRHLAESVKRALEKGCAETLQDGRLMKTDQAIVKASDWLSKY